MRLRNEIGLYEGVDSHADEGEADYRNDDYAYDLDALEPGAAVPADGLEHAPESVGEVEPQGGEPEDVYHENPPVSEGLHKQRVGVVDIGADSGELGELHLRPEMEQVEAEHSENHYSEHEHVARRP